MKKSITAIVLSIVMMLTFAISPAFAATVSNVKTDLPAVTADVKVPAGTFDSLDKSAVKATLDGQALDTGDITAESASTEWIIMVDTTLSLDSASFNAEKAAIKNLRNNLGEKDSLSLYTFETKTTKILDGSESKEDAIKKIDAVKANGQDTAFYAAVSTLCDAAAKSKADSVVAIIYTDGVETLNSDKAAAVKALEKSGVPIYGLCPDSISKDKVDALDSLLKKSGGDAKAFADNKADDVLSSYRSKASETLTLNFTATGDIAANENAQLAIDLGDGNPITYTAPVAAYTATPADTTAEATETTEAADTTAADVTTEPATEDGGLNIIPIAIGAAVVLLLIIAAIVLLGKKKKKPAKEAPVVAEVTEEPAQEEIAEEEPETVEEPVVEDEPAQEEITEEEPVAVEEPVEADTEAEPQEEEEPAEPEHVETEEERAAREAEEERQRVAAEQKASALAAARERAQARAATVARAAKEARASAEAKAAAEEEEKKRLAAEEKAKAKAAKERAKQDKINKKKMKEEGANFQFYFVDKK